MKLKVKTSLFKKLIAKLKGKPFTAITVTIELETPDESRTMFHILNHSDLGDVILNRNYYSGNEHDGKLDEQYSGKLAPLHGSCCSVNEQHLLIEMNKQNVSIQSSGRLEYHH